MAKRHSNVARCNDNNGLIAAVAYYRMSTDKQDSSIPEQRKSVERWAKENGYKIIREYIDEGISGWKEAREGFQRLTLNSPVILTASSGLRSSHACDA